MPRHPLNNVQGLAWGILPYPEDITTQDGTRINNSRVRHDIFTRMNSELKMYDLVIWVNTGRYIVGVISSNGDWRPARWAYHLQGACNQALQMIEERYCVA